MIAEAQDPAKASVPSFVVIDPVIVGSHDLLDLTKGNLLRITYSGYAGRCRPAG